MLADSRLLGTPSFAFVGEPTGCTCTRAASACINADVDVPRPHGATARAPGRATTRSLRAVPFLTRAAPPPATPGRGRRPARSTTRLIDARTTAGVARATSCPTASCSTSTRASRPSGTRGRHARRGSSSSSRARATIEFARRGAGGAARPDEPAHARFLAADGRRACVPKQAWTDVARCRRTASPRSTTGRASQRRRTSPASGSRARRSPRWRGARCVPRAPARLTRSSSERHRQPRARHYPSATLGLAPREVDRRSGTTSCSSSGTPSPLTPERARPLLCDPALGLGADGVLELWTPDDADVAVRRLQPRRLDRRGLGQRHPHRRRLGRRAARTRRAHGPHRRRPRPCAASLGDGRIAVTHGHGGARRPAGRSRRRRDPGPAPLRLDRQPALRASTSTTPRRSRSRPRARGSSTTRASPSARTSRRSGVLDRHRLRMRVWERGVGETQACGSGACAAAVAAIVDGRCASPVTVADARRQVEVERRARPRG